MRPSTTTSRRELIEEIDHLHVKNRFLRSLVLRAAKKLRTVSETLSKEKQEVYQIYLELAKENLLMESPCCTRPLCKDRVVPELTDSTAIDQ